MSTLPSLTTLFIHQLPQATINTCKEIANDVLTLYMREDANAMIIAALKLGAIASVTLAFIATLVALPSIPTAIIPMAWLVVTLDAYHMAKNMEDEKFEPLTVISFQEFFRVVADKSLTKNTFIAKRIFHFITPKT